MARVSAGRLEALPVDRPILVERDGHRIAVIRRGDAVHAVDDSCPHAGGPLSEGTVNDGTLVCPYHGWVWDVATGACRAPARDVRVPVYRAVVEAGEVWIDLP